MAIYAGKRGRGKQWNRQNGRPSIATLCGNFLPAACYSRIADAINAKFKTAYSRSTAIGRAKRLGLAGPDRSDDAPIPQRRAGAPPLHKMHQRRLPKSWPNMPDFETADVKLRCVAIYPRHLSLLELERGDCRYPYGDDAEGEAITFCGHPRRHDSSYCTPHFHLTREPGTPAERAAPVALRLARAA